MRKYLQITLAVLCLAVIPTTAVQAQDFHGKAQANKGFNFDIRPYAGIGFGAFGLKFKNPLVSQTNRVFGGFGKFGVDIGDYLGAELRVGATSTGNKSYAVGVLGSTIPVDASLSDDYFISYLAKFQYPIVENSSQNPLVVYVLVGGTTAKVRRKINISLPTVGPLSINDSTTKTGFSYGFGGEYYVGDTLSIGGEWMQYWTNVNLGRDYFGTTSTGKMWGAVATLAYHF